MGNQSAFSTFLRATASLKFIKEGYATGIPEFTSDTTSDAVLSRRQMIGGVGGHGCLSSAQAGPFLILGGFAGEES
jgi:hypothetical protein